MRTTLLLLSVLSCLALPAQNTFPKLDSQLTVSGNAPSFSKPYTVVVYGGVGCGYSQYLIQHLDALDTCADKTDIVLIMDQPRDSIIKHMQPYLNRYAVFTNTTLGYTLRKKNDIFPQLLLFKNRQQVHHVIGIKERMLTKVCETVFSGK